MGTRATVKMSEAMRSLEQSEREYLDGMEEEIDDTWEEMRVPFYPPVVAFVPGSAIRETFADYFPPFPPYQGRESAYGSFVISRRMPAPFCWKLGFRDDEPPAVVPVRVSLDYPLTPEGKKIASRIVQMRPNAIGEAFGVAYDIYKDIYEADTVLGGGGRLEEGVLNRGRGTYVWGHDMADLVFESFYLKLVQRHDLFANIRFGIGS